MTVLFFRSIRPNAGDVDMIRTPRLANQKHNLTRPLILRVSSNTSGLICKAKASAGVNRLFWFGNGVFLGSTAVTEAFVWNDADGLSEIHVMDDRGMSASTKVQVER